MPYEIRVAASPEVRAPMKPPPPSKPLHVEHHDGVACVTLLTPWLGWEVLDALAALPARLAADPAVRAVVVQSAGPDFSHGADLTDAALADVLRDDGGHRVAARGARLLDAWSELPVPTLAALTGHVVGAGCGLALACDLRYAAHGATLMLPEVARGMHLGWGILPRLVATVGLPAACWIALGGEPVAVEELPPFAVRLADDPRAAALAHARRLAARSPAALAHIKATLARAVDLGLAGDDPARFARTIAGPDFAEGIGAWHQRRAPRFAARPGTTGDDAMKHAEEVLRFWFGDAKDDAAIIADKQSIWFGGGPALDAEIRERFGALVAEAVAGGLGEWSETPRGNLARIILLDQFTRNVYRDEACAFDGDATARALVLHAIERGDEGALRPIERVFLYLPLEHSEDRALQARSVERFTALIADAPAALEEKFRFFRDYAVRHQVIIDRFGRFPHRNAVLGREPTPGEIAYLDGGGETFGAKR